VHELTTNQKGAIAEAAITRGAVEPCVEVYRPAIEGGRYDLIFAFADGQLMRVQREWAARVGWANRRSTYLRLEATRNKQARLINWADKYEFGARLTSSGPIAQLGERVAGSHKVAGSSPAGSIVR
jgi:hypothetical protein